MADFRINVIADPTNAVRGNRVVRNELQRTQGVAAGLGRALASAFAAISVAQAVRSSIRLVDTYTNLQNRLRTVTDSTAELAAVTDALFEVAERTRGSFESTAELYARVALASRELGISQQQTIEFTESLNQAIVLSGATATEASNGLIQLSQGIASGTLRGDELRAVLEQLPVVADVIAESLGITRGELRLLGAEGKIGAEEVLTAFAEAREELQERFAETLPTISQGFQAVRNAAVRLAGEFDKTTGASTALSRTLVALAADLDTVARSTGVVASAIGTALAARAIPAAVRAIQALTVALAANPLTTLAVVITAATSSLVFFSDQIRVSSDGVATLADVAVVGFRLLDQVVSALASSGLPVLVQGFRDLVRSSTLLNFYFETTRDIVAQVLRRFQQLAEVLLGPIASAFKRPFREFEATFGGTLLFIGRSADALLGVLEGTARAIALSFSRIGPTIELAIVGSLNTVIGLLELAFNAAQDLREQLGAPLLADIQFPRFDVSESAKQAALDFGRAFGEGVVRNNVFERFIQTTLDEAERFARARGGDEDGGVDLGRTGARRDTGGDDAFAAFIRSLERENELLAITDDALREQARIIADYEDEYGPLTEARRQEATALIAQGQALGRYNDLLDDIRGPERELIQRQEDLAALFDQGRLSVREYSAALRDLQIELNLVSDRFGDRFIGAIQRSIASVAELGEQIGDVFVRAIQRATDAFIDFLQTGEFRFRDFASSVVQELLRIVAVQAVLQTLSFVGGAIAPGIQNLGIALGGGLPAFATGGEFTVGGSGGTDSQLVAFRATPGERVIVQTPQQQQAATGAPPVVNVQITNVDDPRDAVRALGTAQGERAILNVITRNRAAFNAALRG